jgi:hypothetical protein
MIRYSLLTGVVVLGALAASSASAQPANDECVSATAIALDEVVTGSTETATGADTSGCSVEDFFDVWYAFTPAADATVTISLCGSTFDTTLAVYDGCAGTRLACSEDAPGCSAASRVDCLEVTSGQTYLLRIAGFQQMRGDYSLVVSHCERPENDACVDALPVEKGVPVEGSTQTASGTGLTSACSAQDYLDVWHSYTPAADEEVSISLCGSNFDTTLSVFDACGGTPLACGEDSPACSNPYNSLLSGLNLLGGNTYLIRVAGYENRRGNYRLLLSEVGAPPVVTRIEADQTGITARSEVFFFVYFDLAIQGFNDAADLIINANGLTYQSVSISPSDDAWDVHFEGLEGDGELSIAVSTASDVRSLQDVPLASSVTSAPIRIDQVAPELSGLTVTPSVARPGDVVHIAFESNEPLGEVQAGVNGNPATADKALYSFSYLVEEFDITGPAEVEVLALDQAGNAAYLTSQSLLTLEDVPQVPVAAWPAALALALAGLWRRRR